MQNEDILVIIPARKNSKRIPGKNVKPLSGKPLVEWILITATELPANYDVVISSDDYAIRELAAKFPRIEFIERPGALAEDESPAIEYVKHALEYRKTRGGKTYSAVLILQPTSPFTTTQDILNATELFLRRKPDTVVSVVQVNHMFHPDKFKILEEDLLLQDYLNKETTREYQFMKKVYVRNCSIYLTGIDVVLRQHKIIGETCLGYEMPAERSIDINDPVDFEFAEYLNAKLR